MTLGSIRILTRRQLMEAVAQNWSDTILDELINHAYHLAQKEVMKIDSEAFLEWVRKNIVANESFYYRPEGDWWPNQVRLLDPTSGKYTRLTFKPFDVAEDWVGTAGDPAGTVWSRRSNYIALYPAPNTAITNGLELIHVPTLSLTADTDIPKVPLGLHLAIVYLAKITALGETYQNFDRDVAMVERILGDLGIYYSVTGGENLKWRPDSVKPIGYAGS